MEVNDYLKIRTLDALRIERKILSDRIKTVEERFMHRIRRTVRFWHILCKILSHG